MKCLFSRIVTAAVASTVVFRSCAGPKTHNSGGQLGYLQSPQSA